MDNDSRNNSMRGTYYFVRMAQNGSESKKRESSLCDFNSNGMVARHPSSFFPDMPGPTQMISNIFKPLSKMLEK